MALIASSAEDRCDQLVLLTERLIGLIGEETRMTNAGRWQDAAPVVEEKGKLAALYQMEMRRIAQDRALIEGATTPARDALKSATALLRTALDEQMSALDRARTLTEGLVRAMADEIRAQRDPGLGYGPGMTRSSAAVALDIKG
jgi:hypothetical protein